MIIINYAELVRIRLRESRLARLAQAASERSAKMPAAFVPNLIVVGKTAKEKRYYFLDSNGRGICIRVPTGSDKDGPS